MQRRGKPPAISYNDRLEKTLHKIDELKKKINLRERCSTTIDGKIQAEELENDQKIRALTKENRHLRKELRDYLDQDYKLFAKYFLNRAKSARLSLRRKSLPEVNKEMDEALRGSIKQYNKLQFFKKEKLKKVEALKEKLNKTDAVKVVDKLITSEEKLENGLDEVKIKITTAKKLHDLYRKLHENLEKELRTYPERLDVLEKEKIGVDNETFYIRQVQNHALADVERVLRQKQDMEEVVKLSKKERETVIRNLQLAVYDPMEELRKPSITLRNKAKAKPSLEERVSFHKVKKPSSTLEKVTPEKIAECEKQATLLKFVTGVPLWKSEKMIEILKTQLQLAKDLKSQSDEKFQLATSLHQTKNKLTSELEKIKYDLDERTMKQINERETLLKEAETVIEEKTQKLLTTDFLLKEVLRYFDSILSFLVRRMARFGMEAQKPSGITMKDEDKITEEFEAFSATLLKLSHQTKDRLDKAGFTSEHVLKQPLLPKHVGFNIIDRSNIRVPGLLERKISEEFENFHAQNDDDYLSREKIKRHATIAARAVRKRVA